MEHLKIILEKMCASVGVKYEDIDFKKDRWFMKHEWTAVKEANFIKWLTDYLYNNTKARNTLFQIRLAKTKASCKKAAEFFVFNYGWKTKNP